MPSHQKHRGQHPQDAALFGVKRQPDICQAVSDLSWLLSRGYAEKSSVKLVGDRFRFKERQRKALSRMACTENQQIKRKGKALIDNDLKNKNIIIDGFNILISLEAALSGGIILSCQDGCFRDIASIHGSYKSVMETPTAIELMGQAMLDLEIKSADWYLDSPVSNSGRLKTVLREFAEANALNWQINLVFNPDTVLAKSTEIVVSSDSWILDECQQWFNLSRYLIERYIPAAIILDSANES
ncbi:MAG: DUF434 domain-containing protein [Saprospiraceae bacterium]